MAQPGYSPYPIVLTQLDSVLCVVIGGGEVALRKVSALLESGAHVKVVSPTLHPQLAEWHVDQRFEYAGRPYAPGDLQGAFLAIAATDRQEVNAAVAAEAWQRGILFNVADDPDAGNFYTMGSITRGNVLLAVSTGGDSPALSAHIRRKLEATFGPEYGVLAKRLGELRPDVVNTLPRAARSQLWRALTTDEVLGWLRDGDDAKFEAYVQTLVEEQTQSASSGK